MKRTKWEKMTKAQEAKVSQWYKDGMTIGTNTAPIDQEQAKKAIIDLLKFHKVYSNQKFMFFPSIKAVKKYLTDNSQETHLFDYVKAQEETLWVSHYLACEDIFGKASKSRKHILVEYTAADKEGLMIWDRISKTTGWWWPFENYVLVSDRPREIHMETDMPVGVAPRLHKVGGPAVRFSDDSALYVIRGVRVPKNVAMGDFTAKDILKERNQEVKRCMVDLYTQARLIKDLNATLIHTDEFGMLYTVDVGLSEEIYMVKVIDATAQADGTFKEYFLSVDPKAYGGLKTARGAVASTWRRKDGSFVFASPEEYKPLIET